MATLTLSSKPFRTAALGLTLFTLASGAQAQSCPTTTTPLFDQVNAVDIPFADALDMRLEDLDNDGDQDLIYFTFRNPLATTEDAFQIYRNDIRDCAGVSSCFFKPANNQFLVPGLVGSAGASKFKKIYEVNFFDVDNDGDRDMVMAVSPGEDLVFERDNGVFQLPYTLDDAGQETSDYRLCGGVPCQGRTTTAQYPGDIDRDGDIDIVSVYRDARTRLYLNDGQGTFTEGQVFPDPASDLGAQYPGNGNRDLILFDIDHDGDLDAAVARMNFTTPQTTPPARNVVIYRNDGLGCTCPDGTPGPFCFAYELTAQGGFDSESDSFSITAADIDADGDYDLLQPILNSPDPVAFPTMTRIYLNDGTGQLGQADHSPNACIGDADDTQPPGFFNHRSTEASVWDVDHDGDYDVVTGHVTSDRVWLNDSSGGAVPTFTLADELPSVIAPTNDNTRYARFGDLDLDGDLDYCEANFGGPVSRIFFGRTTNP